MWTCKFFKMKKKFFKKIEKMVKLSLETSKEKNLSEIAWHFLVLRKSHKGFKEKDEKWNEKYMGWSRNSVGIYFGTISFI